MVCRGPCDTETAALVDAQVALCVQHMPQPDAVHICVSSQHVDGTQLQRGVPHPAWSTQNRAQLCLHPPL